MALVEVKNISKSFGRRKRVLQNVSFEVPDRTFFTLLGPSGCGKTTLLRIIAGLEIPDEGTVAIRGRDITRVPPSRRNVSMVFQSYALYPHMTVFRNIATPLRLRNVKEDEIERRVRETAELLGIGDHLEKRPGPLSGGERQRVALARALVREPDVFLMDEPLSNLDALLRERTRTELKVLFSRVGATVIYVTHDQVEAMAMSDIVVVLHDGRIQQAGPPIEIYRRPANEFVAGFVGSPRMNFFTVRQRGETLVFVSGRSFPIPERFEKATTDFPETATCGFRPEDARFDEKGIEFSGEILAVEALGPQSVISVRMPEGDAKIVSSSHVLKKSGTISFSVSEDKIHLFHRPGGEAWATA
ncbi:MAG: ABC transporter ATP-binding protein [Candidatus Hydrogenedentota bacterium]|nr:MAG: ABC transporter ATP-binding protein [Candidatus Hydrogenedentota bacterium]